MQNIHFLESTAVCVTKGKHGRLTTRLTSHVWPLTRGLCDLRNDGRALIDPFYKLPSRKELPDYYEVIRKPMDVRRIVHKIDESKVPTLPLSGLFESVLTPNQLPGVDGKIVSDIGLD